VSDRAIQAIGSYEDAEPYLRPPPIDIRFRVCQACRRRKPTKGGSIRSANGRNGSRFLCADCKPPTGIA
jgi:hypothetical protein